MVEIDGEQRAWLEAFGLWGEGPVAGIAPLSALPVATRACVCVSVVSYALRPLCHRKGALCFFDMVLFFPTPVLAPLLLLSM